MSKKSKKKQHSADLRQQRISKLLNMARQFHGSRQLAEAEKLYRDILSVDPTNFTAVYLLGALAAEVGRFHDAAKLMQAAIRLKPDYAQAHNDLGVVLQQTGDIEGATQCFSKALELNSKFSEATNNLGVTFQSRGNSKKAADYFKAALAINPYYLDAHNNYIFAQDMSLHQTTESLIEIRKQWSATHEEPLLKKQKPHLNDLSLDRKIRIGYISADFRLHSASFVFGGMLTEYNKDKFEVYAYSTFNPQMDERVVQFRKAVDMFTDVSGLPDDVVADVIRKDKIDILVDLAGYSAGNKLTVFARKPAPIQITAWGYATSTGMKSMDYFFTDEVLVPKEEKDLYVEEVVYLPNVVTHYCPENKPDVKELAALKEGIITFGSFNRLAKISDDTFALWAEVLRAVPNSRMILKISELSDEKSIAWVTEKFTAVGVDKERIVFQGKTAWMAHMESFSQVDIALDPFPHGGGVTTLEGLVMGVPVVTLEWPTIVGRLSSSILTTLEMTDWIAKTKEDYVRIAKEKTSDLAALNELRLGLRDKFNSSILGNPKEYCRVVEDKYEWMWKRYVESKSS